jgi:hypothetical protein
VHEQYAEQRPPADPTDGHGLAVDHDLEWTEHADAGVWTFADGRHDARVRPEGLIAGIRQDGSRTLRDRGVGLVIPKAWGRVQMQFIRGLVGGRGRRRRVLAFALAGGALSGLVGGAALAASITIKVNLAPIVDPLYGLLDPVAYQIRTQVPTAGGCGAERITHGIYGVPTPVDVGGSVVPDVLVEVIPTPAVPPLTTSNTVTMRVTKLASGPLPVLVEAILAPSGSAAPPRVAVGYDACSSTAPQNFSAQAIQQPTKLQVTTDISGPGPNLTVIGSIFSSVAGARVNPTAVAARLEPVPSKLTAVVDQLGGGRYHVHATSSAPTKLNLAYLTKTATASTTADLALDQLPTDSDVIFSSAEAVYTVAAPIADATLAVTSTSVGNRTITVDLHALGLPTSASFVKDGPAHATFGTPGAVREATLRFASFEPTATLPALPVNPNQYVMATQRPTFDVVDLRVLDLKSAVVNWGDPVVANVTHRAGPFDVRVDTPDALLTGAVRDLPAQVAFSYAKATQAVNYSGSAPIGSLTMDLVAAQPFMVRAREAHIVASGIPTGLSTVMDRDAKKFAATLTGGTLGSIELQLTSGVNDRLPGTEDGLLYENPAEHDEGAPAATPYVVFARLSGVKSATVGWGDPITADLDHAAAPFQLVAHTFDTNVAGRLANLPAIAHVTYVSRTSGTTLTYHGSAVVGLLTLDADRTTPFTENAKNLHIRAEQLPTDLTINVEGTAKRLTADMPNGALGLLEAQVTSGPNERLADGVNGIKLVQRIQPQSYAAFARLAGLSHAVVNWGDPMGVDLTQTGGPIHISWLQETALGEFGQILNERTAEADIVDLPSQAAFSYSPTTQKITYHGSAPIGRIEADVHTTTDPIVGFANHLHLLTTGIPTQLDNLTIDMTRVNEKTIAVDVPQDQQIGMFQLLVSDGVSSDELPAGTDGLLLYTRLDQNDVEATHHIFARATGIQHFHYTTTTDPNANGSGGERAISTIDSRLVARHPLHVGLVTVERGKPEDTGFVTVDYLAPPETVNLVIDDNKAAGGADFYKQITYSGSSLGGSVNLQTNKGENRTLLDVTLSPVPTVTTACLSGDYSTCDDPFYDQPGTFTVNSPANLTVNDCKENKLEHCVNQLHASGYSGSYVDLSLDIDKVFTLHAEDHQVTGTDNKYLHINTDGELLDGHILKGDLFNFTFNNATFPAKTKEVGVEFPTGFRAVHRYLEVGCDVVSIDPHCFGDTVPGHERGLAACPPGMHINKATPIGEFEFADDYCPSAKPHEVAPAALPAGTTQEVTVWGQDFSPGLGVAFMKGGFPDSDITVTNVQWIWFDQIKVTVSIAPGADTGLRDVFAVNPNDAGANTCSGCFTVT